MSDPTPDDDLLDGMCDLDFELPVVTTDADAPYVVLFADVLGPDECPTCSPAVLEDHAAAWRDLFTREAPHAP